MIVEDELIQFVMNAVLWISSITILKYHPNPLFTLEPPFILLSASFSRDDDSKLPNMMCGNDYRSIPMI